MSSHQLLQHRLLSWYKQHKRVLPWRDIHHPYYTWLSEIMLQQTRVDQATPYFLRFIERFPDVRSLAEAPQQDVLMLWEGLGYYSRARNLHQAAKQIMERYNGQLPERKEALSTLKGIGPYTSAAIASIAFNQAHAVVDGNVQRVISRLFALEDDLRMSATQEQIERIANELLNHRSPGDHNQALMELGATICTPKQAKCTACPIQAHCLAFEQKKVAHLPYKSKKASIPHHHIAVGIVLNEQNKVLVSLRPEDKMLGGLWEFPGGKAEPNEAIELALERELQEELGITVHQIEPFMRLNHAYSHFKITLHSFLCRIHTGTPKAKASKRIEWISLEELSHRPFPKANRRLIDALQAQFSVG